MSNKNPKYVYENGKFVVSTPVKKVVKPIMRTFLEKKDKEYELLYTKALLAGLEAGKNITTNPMIVSGGYAPVMDGVCGFAWVTIKPANSGFAQWLKKQNLGHPGYYGGFELWIHQFNQSMTRKEACAAAMAEVFGKAGINAYPGSRMD